MLLRTMLLIAAVLAMPAGEAAEPADENVGPAETMAIYALRKLEAVVEGCPDDHGARWPERQVVCAAYPRSYSFFKIAWEDVVGRYGLPVNVKGTSPWKQRQGRFERDYEADGHPFTVVFDERSGRLTVAYDPSGVAADVAVALAEAAAADGEAGTRAPMAGFGGVGNPELIPESRVDPVYPERARVYRTDGRVTLQLLVRADGSVGEAKIVAERPEGLGFGPSCLEAARQWRFRPAERDGAPLEVLFTTFCHFEIH
ncbi:MAG: energy transducer TonB [Planctomycetota bacterium]